MGEKAEITVGFSLLNPRRDAASRNTATFVKDRCVFTNEEELREGRSPWTGRESFSIDVSGQALR